MHGTENSITSVVPFSQKGAFTIEDFCAWASVSRTKVYGEIRAKRLPVRKAGGRTLILMADADAWLNALPTAAAA